MKKKGEVSEQYEQDYFTLLGQFVRGEAQLMELLAPDPRDPYQVRRFRPYLYEMEMMGWPPEYVTQVEDRAKSVVRRLNNKAGNKYNTFAKLQE